MASVQAYGERPEWEVLRPRFHVVRLLVSWVLSALALLAAAWIVPGADVKNFGSALVAAAVIAALNAVLPPAVAALRLPFIALLGFLLVLVVDALMLLAADAITDGDLTVDSFWSALGVALVAAAIGVVLDIVLGTNDDDTYTFRVIQRIARRSGGREETDVPGIVFLEIDGLALPVLQRAIRNGSAPEMGRWLQEGSHHLVEWETDLSSQTGASQAGILLGSNDDIPAFRWVEKETSTLMVCSAPADCAEIERRHRVGRGLLANGGASRGNLLSGEADHVILTASRSEAERHANPGYRAFFANGFNVLRSLVLFFWEVVLEISAALRASRRDVRPRGHRGGYYPLLRAALCVVVRDLIVYGVLSDMMKGRPAIYATFSSYDEVAHHSGLERPDTMEALRKLDQQFGRIDRARRYAARPYEIVVLSDHGQTQGATFKQRNGYGLDELVQRSVEQGEVADVGAGDENKATVGRAVDEASGHKRKKPSKKDVSGRDLVVLGSGQPRPDLPPRRAAQADARGDRRAASKARSGAPRAPARRLAPHPVGAAGRARARSARHSVPRDRTGRGRGSAGGVLAERGSAPCPQRRIRPRGRHLRRQLLRPGARGRVRVRGADLLSRRPRRAADAAVPALPGDALAADGLDHRRRRGERRPARLAARAPGCPRSRRGAGHRARRSGFVTSTAAASPTQAKAASVVLLTLAAGQFLMTLDTSVMNVSIATVAKDTVTTVTGIQGPITE